MLYAPGGHRSMTCSEVEAMRFPFSPAGRWTLTQLHHVMRMLHANVPSGVQFGCLNVTTQQDTTDWYIVTFEVPNGWPDFKQCNNCGEWK